MPPDDRAWMPPNCSLQDIHESKDCEQGDPNMRMQHVDHIERDIVLESGQAEDGTRPVHVVAGGEGHHLVSFRKGRIPSRRHLSHLSTR